MSALDLPLAERMLGSSLGHLGQTWPHHISRYLSGPADLEQPQVLHPIFHGSYDWHSCVHGWWQVVRLARLFPQAEPAGEVGRRLAALFTPDNCEREMTVFNRAGGTTFERPYGWAWLLALHRELVAAGHVREAEAVAPLARLLSDRFTSYLGRLQWPVRSGGHSSTAFAMLLAGQWASSFDSDLSAVIAKRSRDWFLSERPAPWLEPGGEDFLSPTLITAALMITLPGEEHIGDWLQAYLEADGLNQLEVPVTVSDRSDGRIAHLDGLNLSRAWCWKLIAAQTEGDLHQRAQKAASAHLAASLPHITGDYMGEHWLSSFAVLALTTDLADETLAPPRP